MATGLRGARPSVGAPVHMSDDALSQGENNAQSTGQNENVCCELAVIGANHTLLPKHRRQPFADRRETEMPSRLFPPFF